MSYIDDEFLAHHGILGMKWGVRRWQNKDGSLTPAGRQHYGIKDYKKYETSYNPKSKIQSRYYNKLTKKGVDPQHAKAISYNRYRRLKKVAIGAGIMLGVAAAIKLRKYTKGMGDTILKEGKTISRLTLDPNDMKYKNALYSTFKKSDNKLYDKLYTAQLSGPKDVHRVNYKLLQNTKIAGWKNGKKILNESIKSSSSARKQLRDYVNSVRNEYGVFFGPNGSEFGKNLKSLADKLNSGKTNLSKKDYITINQMFTIDSKKTRSFTRNFGEQLKSKGYDGVKDINDQIMTMYRSNNPIITFNNKKLSKVADKIIDYDDKLLKGATAERIKRGVILPGTEDLFTNPYTYAYGSIGAGVALGNEKRADKRARKYLKEHPDSKMSYYEALQLSKKHKL